MDETKPSRNYLLIGLQVALALAACGYLAFALFDLARRPTGDVCESVEVRIMDSARAGFITREEVENILAKKSINLVGAPMANINSEAVRNTLLKNPFISEATCYKTPDRRFNILVSQRLPVMRVMAADGDDYYLDAKGKAMEPTGYSADLIVATGHITRPFAKDTLLRLGLFLRDNNFWNDQVVQADVRADGSVDLVTRVGNAIVHLGTLTELDTKFRNLRALYDKVLPTVGWNKYAVINVEHTSQIICKRNKKS
ncbi:MAG: cell division protein FtsQ [Bacteroidaceae bacterium]|nr:cell division protein FtsQ [Bacteroidaceae bacterium]